MARSSSRTSHRLSTLPCRDGHVESSPMIKLKTRSLHVCVTFLVFSAILLEYGCLAKERKLRIPARKLRGAYACLGKSNDAGCGVFQCLKNIDSCQLDGLNVLCTNFLRTAGEFKRAGKVFIKDSLMCMTRAIKKEFTEKSMRRKRTCDEMEEFVSRIQKDCYSNNSLCTVAKLNARPLMEVLAAEDVLSKKASLKLFQMIMGCDEETTVQYRSLITSTIGQSFLSTLHYLQDGASFSLMDILGNLIKRID